MFNKKPLAVMLALTLSGVVYAQDVTHPKDDTIEFKLKAKYVEAKEPKTDKIFTASIPTPTDDGKVSPLDINEKVLKKLMFAAEAEGEKYLVTKDPKQEELSIPNIKVVKVEAAVDKPLTDEQAKESLVVGFRHTDADVSLNTLVALAQSTGNSIGFQHVGTKDSTIKVDSLISIATNKEIYLDDKVIEKASDVIKENIKDNVSRGIDFVQTNGTATVNLRDVKTFGITEGMQSYVSGGAKLQVTAENFLAKGKTAVKVLTDARAPGSANTVTLKGNVALGANFQKKPTEYEYEYIAAYVTGTGSTLNLGEDKHTIVSKGSIIAADRGKVSIFADNSSGKSTFDSNLHAYDGSVEAKLIGFKGSTTTDVNQKELGSKYYGKTIAATGNNGKVNVTFDNTDFRGLVLTYQKGEAKINLINAYSNATFTAESDSKVLANFKNAVYEGNATVQSNGKVEMAFTDSKWNLSGSSTLEKLSLSNTMLVFGQSPQYNNVEAKFDNSHFQTLTVNGTLTADHNSIIVLNMDSSQPVSKNGVATDGDKLVVNALVGSPKLKLVDKQQDAKLEKVKGCEFIFVKDNAPHGHVKAYRQDGLLKNRTFHLAFKDKSTKDGYGAWVLSDIAHSVDTDFVNANVTANRALYTLWRSDMLSLNERMGTDLLNAGEKQRVWVRTSMQGIKATGDYHFDTRVNSVALGHTLYAKRLNNETRYRGLTLEAKRMNADKAAHIDRAYGYGLGAYQTDVFDNQVYVDTVLRVNRWHSGASVTVDGEALNPTYNVWGASLSSEIGKRIDIAQTWFIQPSAQLMAGYLQGKNWANDEVVVKQKAIRSVVGRLGVNLGKETEDKRQRVYAKLDAYHNFLGHSELSFDNGDTFVQKSTKKHDTWMNVGVGASTMLGKSAQLYADAQASVLGKTRTKYDLNVGVKWTLR